MIEKVRYFVEVFLIENNFITFDFGEFAIVLRYDVYQDSSEVSVYVGVTYREIFMSDWSPQINDITHTIEMNDKDFNSIKRISAKCMRNWKDRDWYKFTQLLEKYFMKQLESYGCYLP